jgi:CRAL/TRIO domain
LIIEDLQGLSRKVISSHIASFYGETMHLDQTNYPDTAKKIIITRTPIIFRMVWSIVKHFFGAHIVEKMEFAGGHNYLQVLEKYIDLEILPSCIFSKGNGEAVSGMSSSFQGGEI